MTKAERKQFGERVYNWRIGQDLTVRDGASALRVSVGTLYNIEGGKGCLERTRIRIEKILTAVTVAA